ncbi:hypothetical protein J2X31_001941 [Flavobacterium arsenatis]|uniref:Secretion system C-terminal sorting domain-containing protein n=1 Tax=Flavobacterium arsenatis TaxID=1484332 RepID=A0ABU1TR49_9FLAO|nr:T9SS type A sorting domain-containing protein [Flavobacterium arsenatis]MDR6967927.1 hypothetical protein [Flavobacterium arsenatis]
MKKILLLLLLITARFYGQVEINQPTTLSFCDIGNDGVETFDLTSVVPEILGTLNPSEYLITYYSTQSGAQSEDIESLILFPANHTILTGPSTAYFRVEEIADPENFAWTFLHMQVVPLPVFNIDDVVMCQGTAAFMYSGLNAGFYSFQWFSGNTPIPGETTTAFQTTESGTYKLLVTDLVTGCSYEDSSVVTVIPAPTAEITDYSLMDQLAVFTISGTPSANVTYSVDSIPTTVVLNATGVVTITHPISTPNTVICLIEVTGSSIPSCTAILSSCVTLEDSTEIVNIPDANFKAKLLAASTTNEIAKDLNGNWIAVDVNDDGEIQYSEALTVSFLDVQLGGIASMQGIESFTNLLEIDCSLNELNSLNISSLINLQHLKCRNNPITELQLANNVDLLSLEVGGSTISNINLGGNISITKLHIENTLIESFNLGNLINLTDLAYSPGYTNFIGFENKSGITSLSIFQDNFTTFNFFLFPNLISVGCNDTSIEGIDLSYNLLLTSLNVSNNDSLGMLNLKNGGPNLSSYQILSNTLNFVCVNDTVGDNFINYLIQSNNGPVSVSSYCSFLPGGDYNTIKGKISYDLNLNGCDALDFPAIFTKVSIELDGASTDFVQISDNLGKYNFYTSETGIFTVTPQLENPSLFTVSPATVEVDFPINNNSVSTNNFCITANGIHPDLEVVIAPLVPARPGFDAVYQLVYKNKGNQTVDGYVNFTYNETVLDFVSSSIVPQNQSDGHMNWVVSNIAPFASGSIDVTLNVNSPQETPAINIDDILTFNAFIDVSTDDNWTDNNFDFSQTVVGSFDPNDIICLEGESEAPSAIGNYLHYIVNFENTGTAPAENVVVKVDIDATKYDVSSLQLLNGSHPLEARLNNNVAEFIFKVINLETNGHGNILLKIRSKTSLNAGDTVTKKANIFFDYNFPILTNDANTTFQDLAVEEHLLDNSIKIYPNPSSNLVKIEADAAINSVQVYDMQGRLLMTHLANDVKTSIDISNKTNGVYFFKIYSEKGIKVEKVIKK